ncbi:MAG: phosphotransferase [Candidatus Cloacimonetes bacterium]|nr:phosphotransferase [Candidatus Cloacimonadota bacterium]
MISDRFSLSISLEVDSLLITAPDKIFTKKLTDPQALERELAAYRLDLPMLPRLVEFIPPDTICVQKIDGISYLDCWDAEIPAHLAETIAGFHLATYDGINALCHWDNQPRNILVSGAQVFLVDFADSRYAPPEADLTHLFLFWAAQMEFQPFINAVNRFLQVYTAMLPLQTQLWQESLAQSRSRFDLRRATYRKHLQPVSGDTGINRSYLDHIQFSHSG